MRTSELIALRWQDVDLEQNRIFVKTACVRGQLKGTKTKSGKREVTLQPQAREALLNQQTYSKRLNENVFHDPRTGKAWKDDQPIRKIVWTPALKRGLHEIYSESFKHFLLCISSICSTEPSSLEALQEITNC